MGHPHYCCLYACKCCCQDINTHVVDEPHLVFKKKEGLVSSKIGSCGYEERKLRIIIDRKNKEKNWHSGCLAILKLRDWKACTKLIVFRKDLCWQQKQKERKIIYIYIKKKLLSIHGNWRRNFLLNLGSLLSVWKNESFCGGFIPVCGMNDDMQLFF